VKFHIHMLLTCRIYLNHDSDFDRFYINLYSPKKTVATQKHSSASINTNKAKTTTKSIPIWDFACQFLVRSFFFGGGGRFNLLYNTGVG